MLIKNNTTGKSTGIWYVEMGLVGDRTSKRNNLTVKDQLDYDRYKKERMTVKDKVKNSKQSTLTNVGCKHRMHFNVNEPLNQIKSSKHRDRNGIILSMKENMAGIFPRITGVGEIINEMIKYLNEERTEEPLQTINMEKEP